MKYFIFYVDKKTGASGVLEYTSRIAMTDAVLVLKGQGAVEIICVWTEAQ